MKTVSVINSPGGVSRCTEETRIVGFRVAVSEIEAHKGTYGITNPDIIVDIAIQYLKDKGYTVEKSE